MAFHNTVFPTNISLGSSGGPGYKTEVVMLDNGAEQRVARWATPRHQYNVAYGVKKQTDLNTLKHFYIARQGATHTFPYWDPSDYSTGVDGQDTPVRTDVLIGMGDATETAFQLIKKYTSGSQTVNRTITKPKNATVVMEIDSVLKTEGVDFTVNYDTGVITFGSAPGNTLDIKAGFEFYVECRFAQSTDAMLDTVIQDYDSGDVAIELVEVPFTGIQVDDFWFGGSHEEAFGADITISMVNGRSQFLQATTTSLDVFLPDKSSVNPGPNGFWIFNVGSNTYTVKDGDDLSTVVSIAAGQYAHVMLTLDVSSAKAWYAV